MGKKINVDNLESFKKQENEEENIFFLTSSKFDCSLLWAMFCFALEMMSGVIAKLPICIVSYPAALDLSFYSRCSPAKAVRHLLIYRHNGSLPSSISDASLKEKGIKETSEFDQRPAASSRSTAAVLTGVCRPCVQIGT